LKISCLNNQKEKDQVKQENKEAYLQKWNEFRARRTVAIEKYIAAKRISVWARRLNILMALRRIVKHAFGTIEKTHHYIKWRKKIIWLQVLIMVNNKCCIKRYGGIPKKHHNFLKYSFSQHVNSWRELLLERSKWIVKDSIVRNA
jgi:hypothetical protein